MQAKEDFVYKCTSFLDILKNLPFSLKKRTLICAGVLICLEAAAVSGKITGAAVQYGQTVKYILYHYGTDLPDFTEKWKTGTQKIFRDQKGRFTV